MTPEEVQKLQEQLTRYGTSYDPEVDQYCPPLVRIKSGAIAKRQPKVRDMGTHYWKAQCSFRGLKVSGRIYDLKDRVRDRDRTKDVTIKHELDRVSALLREHYRQEEIKRVERRWKDPSTSLEWKVECNAQRALKELLEQEPVTRGLCLIVQTISSALIYWAKEFDLACEIVEPPESMFKELSEWGTAGSWTVLGRKDLVQQKAKMISAQAKAEAQAAQAKAEAEAQAEQARADRAKAAKAQEEKVKYAAILEEAKEMADWDLTGSWIVQCHELATLHHYDPVPLTMEIYHDDYRLDDVRDLDGMNDDDYYDARYDLTWEEQEERKQADANMLTDQPHIPRYFASFDFGHIAGTMRIFPPRSSTTKRPYFKVCDNPAFEYVWRGRESGEGQIETGADADVHPFTFTAHGTAFKATYPCPFSGVHEIVGKKVAHGRGRKSSSKEDWRSMSQSAWDRECTSRWH